MSSTPRTRKWWTEEEDRILRGEAERQLSKGAIKDWNTIAAKLHDRTNKDCRKRWSKVCGNVQKGAWSCVEDERLQNAVEQYGQKWTDVAEIVGTRYPEQCAKRWQHSLDPSVDHSEWTPEMDERLMAAVEKFGRNWRAIGEREFRHRSTTDIKNRYVILKRRQRNKTEYTEADSSLRDVAEDISVLDAEFDMEDMDFYIEDLVNDSFPTHFPDTPASSSSRQGRRGDKSSLAETQILQDTLINNHDALLPFLDSTINAWDNNAPTMNAKLGPGEHTGPDFDFPMCDLFQAALPLQDSQSSRNREEGQIPTQDMQGNTLITSSSEGYNTSGAKTIHRNTVILEDVHPETLNTIMGTLLESKTKVKITFN